MRRNFLIALVILTGSLFACSTGTQQTEKQPVKKENPGTTNLVATKDTVSLLTVEDAETLVGKHYSALNREAQYLLYRYLLVKIDSIGTSHGDTIPIFATVNGRKWLTPNGDTTTQSFRESIMLRAYRKDNGWQAN